MSRTYTPPPRRSGYSSKKWESPPRSADRYSFTPSSESFASYSYDSPEILTPRNRKSRVDGNRPSYTYEGGFSKNYSSSSRDFSYGVVGNGYGSGFERAVRKHDRSPIRQPFNAYPDVEVSSSQEPNNSFNSSAYSPLSYDNNYGYKSKRTSTPKSKSAWGLPGRSKSKSVKSYQEESLDIEGLMDLVLTLQDQGKLEEVAPVLNRIKRMQEAAEKKFDQEMVASGRPVPERTPLVRHKEEAMEYEMEKEQKEEEQKSKEPTKPILKKKSDTKRKSEQVSFAPDVKVETEMKPQISEPLPDSNTPAFDDTQDGSKSDSDKKMPKSKKKSKIINLIPSIPNMVRGTSSKTDVAKTNAPLVDEQTVVTSVVEEDSPLARAKARKEAIRKRKEKEKKEKELEKDENIDKKKVEASTPQPGRKADKKEKKGKIDDEEIGIDVLLLPPPPEEKHALRSFKDQMKTQSMKRAATIVRDSLRLNPKTKRHSYDVGVNSSVQYNNSSMHSVNEAKLPKRRMVTRVGYMKKSPPQGKRMARWRTRYFVLSGRTLIYSKYEGSKGSQGVIFLAGATVEAVKVPSSLRRRVKDMYEVRIANKGSKRVYRLRPEVKRDVLLKRRPGESKSAFKERERKELDHIFRKEAKDWAAAIRNNIIIADEEGDILKKDKKKIQQKIEKDEKRASMKRMSLRKSPSKNRLWESGRNLGEEADDLRKKNHFNQPNGAPLDLGVDVGKKQPGEDINVHYNILNVSPTATGSMIKKAYRAMARDLHPDKNPDKDRRHFAEIARAFDILKDKESRARYDLCERVKQILRQGLIVRIHDQFDFPKLAVIFTDSRFLNIYMQDVEYGTVLNEGYKTFELRYVTHIFAGSDGFQGFICPPGRADMCLTLHGDRMGCRDVHIEMETHEARDDFLDGLRILRCNSSELFKQRLDEMMKKNMR